MTAAEKNLINYIALQEYLRWAKDAANIGLRAIGVTADAWRRFAWFHHK